MDKIISSALPSIILLSIVWTILATALFFIRYQVKKEENNIKSLIDENEKESLSREIDDLAVYVSKLPRSKEIIKEYRNEEKE
ncbi:MAG: hypothetical protein U0354_10470 [Candidatus Sericytochromatia bacterium]